MLVACYGSLKEGFYNHGALGKNAKLVGKSVVRGVMYWNGSYPKLYKIMNAQLTRPKENGCYCGAIRELCSQGARDHVLEIYEVDDTHAEYIRLMEVGAGYVPEQIETEFGPATIYYMPHDRFDADDTWIEAYTLALFDKLLS